MNVAPWTPGPWRVEWEAQADELTSWGPAIAAGDGEPEPTGPNRYVAEVISDGDEESNANARLIAAAPEIAELLSGLYEQAASRAYPDEEIQGAYVNLPRTRELLDRIRGSA